MKSHLRFASSNFVLAMLVALLTVGMLVTGIKPVLAGADDYPAPWRAPTAPDKIYDTWGYWNRECTSFVAWRLHSRNGFEMSRAIGNANLWGSWASSHGYAVNMTSAVGAVAWFSSGHVAWVESVNGGNGNYNERTIPASSVSGYIHFKDLASSPTPTPTPTPPPNLQTLAADSNGQLYHAIRNTTTGGWNGYNNLAGDALIPGGSVTSLAAVNIGGSINFLEVSSGQEFHAIRNTASGSWNGFNSVQGAAAVPASVTAVAATNIGGDLHSLVLDSNGNLYHAIRSTATGSWNGYNNVAGAAVMPGPISAVATANISGDLHILIVSGGQVFHAIRYTATGAWNGFNSVAGGASVPPSVSAITAASVAGDLHVLTTSGGQLFHAVRLSANGSWSGFNNVAGAASVPPSVLAVSATEVAGDLQILLVASSQIYHAIRSTNGGSWNGFNNISAGAAVPAGTILLTDASA